MATNLKIDDRLLTEAVKVGGHPSKRAAVAQALEEYIRRHKQQDIIKLFGEIDIDSRYDYKKQRRKS